MFWVLDTLEELIKAAVDGLEISTSSCNVSEDGGKILDADVVPIGRIVSNES